MNDDVIALIGGEKHQSVKTDGVCTTLCSSMGTGGGYIPMIVKMAGDRMAESKSNEIIVIGKMDHTLDNTHESANRVYSKDGICPTIPTCAGGNIQPKIIDDTEEKHQSVIIDDIYKNRDARVYKDVSPTLRSRHNNELKTIVAMRGRNPENPSDRTAGAKTEQRLEPNGDGVCNTLTSVQKDNLVLEVKPECINLHDEQGKRTSFQDRVYKTDKISPAITTSFRPNYAVEEKKINKIGQISNEGSQCGTVVSDDGLFPTITAGTHGYANPHICTKSKETDSERFFNQALETFVENDCEPGDTINAYNKTVDKSGLCPTLTTRPEGFKTAILPVVENNNSIKIKQATKQGYIECKAGGVADFSYPESKLRRGRVQGGGDVSPTLTSSNLGVCKVESRYRIRKLTPRECWRLMGFSDEDFDKAAAVNSNTQLYKQAGNSIVKNVLMAIFKQMIEC